MDIWKETVMSPDVIQIVRERYKSDLEIQIAFQCAPLLAGIKVSNILIITPDNKANIIKIFEGSQISFYLLYESEKRTIFLLYDSNGLENYLKCKSVVDFLEEADYQNLQLQFILQEFSRRFCEYMNQRHLFPHEMGLLLGYPVEDVRGYVANQGRHCLYPGYWKVYHNVDFALSVFENYNKAQDYIIRLVAQGVRIQCIISDI